MLKNIFPVPLWVSNLNIYRDDVDQINKDLSSCVKLVKEKNLLEESEKPTYFKSTYFSYSNIIKDYSNLERIIAQECIKYFNLVNVGRQTFKITHSWINISNEGEEFMFHTHFPGLISGVIYIKAPKNSGNIKFKNPIRESIHGAFPFIPNSSKPIENTEIIYYPYYEVVPEDLTLVIFPSWIEHTVEENNTKEERISLAFNCTSSDR